MTTAGCWQLLRMVALAIAVTPVLSLATAGCSRTIVRYQKTERPRFRARWVLLPFVNHSETPQAGERVEALMSTLLRAKGLGIDGFAPPKEDESRLTTSDQQRLEESIVWAKNQKYEYVVTGSVEEWRYKAGIDNEPAVGITVRIVELAKNQTVWSASGSKTGGAGENVSGTALKLLDSMVTELE
jgi:hypothetical protein